MDSKKFTLILPIVIVVILFATGVFTKRQTEAPIVEENTPPVLDYGAQIEGNRNDLIQFSVLPNTRLSGVVEITGEIKNGYFHEGNILVNILDSDMNMLRPGYATATSEWMTVEPVAFKGEIDLTGLPAGTAYIEIHNDNASGLPEHDKNVLVPIVIE